MTDPDLKELDDLLPEDLVAIIEANREFFRALYTGIPDRRLEREGFSRLAVDDVANQWGGNGEAVGDSSHR